MTCRHRRRQADRYEHTWACLIAQLLGRRAGGPAGSQNETRRTRNGEIGRLAGRGKFRRVRNEETWHVARHTQRTTQNLKCSLTGEDVKPRTWRAALHSSATFQASRLLCPTATPFSLPGQLPSQCRRLQVGQKAFSTQLTAQIVGCPEAWSRAYLTFLSSKQVPARAAQSPLQLPPI